MNNIDYILQYAGINDRQVTVQYEGKIGYLGMQPDGRFWFSSCDAPLIMSELKKCKLILKDFPFLVKAVQDNPRDNPAVRACKTGYLDDCNFTAWHDGVNLCMGPYKNEVQFKITDRFLVYSTLFVDPSFLNSLRSEGYAVGIPSQYYITP